MTSSTPHAVVIGAGPYGLAVSAHLRGRGLTIRTFGDPLASWRRHMPVGMYLKSEPSASSISAPALGYSLADFYVADGRRPLDDWEPLPIEMFIRYGQWFQEQLVPVEQEQIVRVARGERGFDVELATGEVIRTRAVVVAAGHLRFAHTPAAVAALAGDQPMPTKYVSHTNHHADLSVFAGSEVAVIGGGQSALESAALLHEAGAGVHLVVRSPRLVWSGETEHRVPTFKEKIFKPPSCVGPGWSLATIERGAGFFPKLPVQTRLWLVKKILGPFGSWWLHDRVIGVVDVRTGQEIRAAEIQGDKVVCHIEHEHGGREQLVVDHVLAGTGYRVDVDALEFLDPNVRAGVERESGYPALGAGFDSTVPGLYFVGLASAGTFGPLMRFVCGTDFAAPRVARAVASFV